MRFRILGLFVAGGILGVSLNSGCSSTERANINFSYVVQPEKSLPPGMKTIAIQAAKVGPTTDEKWSDISATVLLSLVNESRSSFGTPVTVTDRRDTQVTFDEADLAGSGMSTAKGGSPGQLLAAQGAILSNINVKVEKHVGKQRTLSGFDLSGLMGEHTDAASVRAETAEVETVTRNMTVQTDFKLVDTSNNRVWDQDSSTHNATERTEASPFFGSSKTEAELTPQDRIIGTLVERGARKFISRFMPVRIEVRAEVASSGNKSCAEGVRLLRAEQYDQAVSMFRNALNENPNDHRAAFGAGVASEAAGQYSEALSFYQRSLAGQENEDYKEARDRVKTYGTRVRG